MGAASTCEYRQDLLPLGGDGNHGFRCYLERPLFDVHADSLKVEVKSSTEAATLPWYGGSVTDYLHEFGLRKYDIVNLLGLQFAFDSYLEICSPTTGLTFSQVDDAQFTRRKRVMYRTPESDGGLSGDTFTEAATSQHLVTKLLSAAEDEEGLFDVIFVDPFHDHDTSTLDIVGAIALLRPHGVLVVHDCSPPNVVTTGPNRTGEWCGETYAAFIDVFVAGRWPYLTVDSDYGCGVVFRDETMWPSAWPRPQRSDVLRYQWLAAGEDRFAFLERHRSELLNLISPQTFCRGVSDACEKWWPLWLTQATLGSRPL